MEALPIPHTPWLVCVPSAPGKCFHLCKLKLCKAECIPPCRQQHGIWESCFSSGNLNAAIPVSARRFAESTTACWWWVKGLQTWHWCSYIYHCSCISFQCQEMTEGKLWRTFFSVNLLCALGKQTEPSFKNVLGTRLTVWQKTILIHQNSDFRNHHHPRSRACGWRLPSL